MRASANHVIAVILNTFEWKITNLNNSSVTSLPLALTSVTEAGDTLTNRVLYDRLTFTVISHTITLVSFLAQFSDDSDILQLHTRWLSEIVSVYKQSLQELLFILKLINGLKRYCEDRWDFSMWHYSVSQKKTNSIFR